MFKKKHIFILLLIVGICAMSSVSAADNVSDVVTLDDAPQDDVATNLEQDLKETVEDTVGESVEETSGEDAVDGEKLSASEDDSKLTVYESEDKLSMIFGNWYSVDLSDTIIASDKTQKFNVYISPCQISGSYGYDFNFVVVDKNGNTAYTRHYQSTSIEERDYSITIQKNTLTPGTYVMGAINDYDGVVMDAAYLYVSGNAVVTANNYRSTYMSGAKMTGRITDQVTGKALTSLDVKVVFTKGKTSITKYYSPDINGYFSFEPPVGVGTWTVTITPNAAHIAGSTVNTATITKSSVKVKAKKVVEYKGFKITLKATVKSHGKNVNEGKVLFKINGKKYKVNVKNGVAVKKLKLKKVKKYKYTAKYLGTGNLLKSKASSSKAIMKKRQKVKIKFKMPVLYTGQVKKVVVKIKSHGKYVKGGWLKLKTRNGVEKVKNKKGKIKLYASALLSDHYKGTNGIDSFYKKTVTKKYWVKYIPESHKYLPKKVKYKGTSKFKCDLCGKKTTHYHYSYGYVVKYKYKIVVS